MTAAPTGAVIPMMMVVTGKHMAANQEGEKNMAKKIVQTAGRDALGNFAPDFARYNDDILFQLGVLSYHLKIPPFPRPFPP